MSFMDSLAANPQGSSTGIYGNQGGAPVDYSGPLGVVNQLKDREMRDFQNKAEFMSDLSLKQDRLRNLFDPQQQQQQQPQAMGVQVAHDPSAMTGYQKGELGIKQQELGIKQGELSARQQQIAQTGKMGEERLGIQRQQEQLNETRNAQTNDRRTQDMQRKIEDSTKKFELAQAELDRKTKAGEDTIEAHKNLAAAVEERHKAELALKDRQFETANKQHQEVIDNLEKERKTQKESTTTSTERDEKGNVKGTITKETKKGATDTIEVTDASGTKFTIPSNKKDEWNKNHAHRNYTQGK